MAIWQFDFQLVYKSEYSNSNFLNILPSSILQLSLALPPHKSWDDDIIILGDPDATCIEFCYIDSKIVEILVRLHVEELSPNIVDAITQFASSNQLYILSLPDERIMECTPNNIRELVLLSRAYQYLKNPSKYLDNINDD